MLGLFQIFIIFLSRLSGTWTSGVLGMGIMELGHFLVCRGGDNGCTIFLSSMVYDLM